MATPATRVSRQRASTEGLGSNQKAVKYLGQDFETLRQQCLDLGVLFKDPEFPACPSALGYKDLGPHSPQTEGIVWKRPPVRRRPRYQVSDGTEGSHLWLEVVGGEGVALGPKFLDPMFQNTSLPLKIFSRGSEVGGKRTHGLWDHTS